MLRIRAVNSDDESTDEYSLLRGLATLYAEGGIAVLYSALVPLLVRELPFSVRACMHASLHASLAARAGAALLCACMHPS